MDDEKKEKRRGASQTSCPDHFQCCGRSWSLAQDHEASSVKRSLQALGELVEDAKPLRGCEEKRKVWAKHWQCDSEVQGMQDKPWRNEELRSLEERLPRLKEEGREKAARSCKATCGSEVPPDWSKDTRGDIVKFVDKVEHCGRWPQQAFTTITALCPTLIRWWEWLRAPELSRWQERHRVGWDTTGGRDGGAQRTVWKTLLEMERLDYRVGDMDHTVVLDLARTCQSPSCVGVDDALQQSHQNDFASAVWPLQAPAEGTV